MSTVFSDEGHLKVTGSHVHCNAVIYWKSCKTAVVTTNH